MSKYVSIFINTSDNQMTKVKIEGDGILEELVSSGKPPQAQGVLTLIETLLKKHNISLKDIKQVEFYPGPGSYTGLRVGAAVANAMGWLLGINKPQFPTYE